MKILFASSEVAPFAKVGGLGDVSAALPRKLAEMGHDVRLVMPYYGRVQKGRYAISEALPDVRFKMGPHDVRVGFLRGTLPDSDVPVYFVRCGSLFDRESVYGAGPEEALRFGVLNWAALALCQHLRFAPDVVHVNDWQTSLIPVMLRSVFAWDRLFARTRTVLTIHNMGHQGTFEAQTVAEVGLGSAAHLVHQDALREGRFGFLQTGLLHANAVTTVSPTYAREIQTPEHGVGLDGTLRGRADVLFGILNGIDEHEWDPTADPHLPARFSADDLRGKAVCKARLQAEVGLPEASTVPLAGIVSRLVWQKGFDLVMQVLPDMLRRRPLQLVVLGTGESRYEDFFRALANHFPRQVAFVSKFSEPVAHRIEAGADLFLMPSRYEPCGLNQLYSLRYGTVPVVHRTGGLADSVWPVDVRRDQGTGFVFDHFNADGFRWALESALALWGNGEGESRARWQRVAQRGMRLPLGWSHRAQRYVDVYRKVAPEAG